MPVDQGFENWTGFGFWYRESPQEFRADTLGQDIPRHGNATVDLWYPGWSVAGTRGVRLDNAGLLRWIQAIPPMEKGVAIEEKSLLFKALATALNGSKKRTCLGSHAKLVMVQH